MWNIGDQVMTDLGPGTVISLTVGGGANVHINGSGTRYGQWISMGPDRILYVIQAGSGGTATDVFSPEQLEAHQAAVNGSTTVTAAPQPLIPSIQEPVTTMLTEGMDLRDVNLFNANVALDPSIEGDGSGGTGEFNPGLFATALLLLKGFMRSPGAVTSAAWNLLPTWAKAVLIQGGIGIGSFLAIDAFGGGDEEVTPFGPALGPALPPALAGPGVHVDAFGTHLPSAVIGSWNTNKANPAMGQTFYRLMDGKLATMRKSGKWRIWKPKKPVVLYAGGVKNIKTLLKADKILTQEAKKLRAYLDRRAPRPRKATKDRVIAISGGSATALPIHHA